MLRLPARTNTRRAAPADDHAVTELVLYAENTEAIYTRSILPVIKNLATKLRKGTFNKTRAVDAFVYVADAAAKQYNAEFGSGRGYGPFTVATRRAAAAELLDNNMEAIEHEAGGKVARNGLALSRRNGLALSKRNGLALSRRNGLALSRRNGEVKEAEILAAFKSSLDAGSVLEGVSVAHQAKYDSALPKGAKIGTCKIGTGPQGKGVAVQFAVTSGKKKLGTGYYKPKHGSVWVTWG